MAFGLGDYQRKVSQGFREHMDTANTVAYLFGPAALQQHGWKRLRPVMDELIGMMPNDVLQPRVNMEASGSMVRTTSDVFQPGGVLGQQGFDINSIAELLGLNTTTPSGYRSRFS